MTTPRDTDVFNKFVNQKVELKEVTILDGTVALIPADDKTNKLYDEIAELAEENGWSKVPINPNSTVAACSWSFDNLVGEPLLMYIRQDEDGAYCIERFIPADERDVSQDHIPYISSEHESDPVPEVIPGLPPQP